MHTAFILQWSATQETPVMFVSVTVTHTMEDIQFSTDSFVWII